MPQSGSSSDDAESCKRDQNSVLVVDDDVDARVLASTDEPRSASGFERRSIPRGECLPALRHRC